MIEKHKQVADQCDAVAYLARTIATVHEQKAGLFRGDVAPTITDLVGNDTASLMETLGNILNGMDAASDEDSVLDPVFERAHQMFPQTAGDS